MMQVAERQPHRLSVERRNKRTPSTQHGKPWRPIPPERKAAILEDAKQLILQDQSIDQIAAKHGISHSTLYLWLHALGDEYKALREAWLDGMLLEAGELLKHADDPLSLARGRELWRRATWYAERRDRARYGDSVQVEHVTQPILNINIVAGSQHAAVLPAIEGELLTARNDKA